MIVGDAYAEAFTSLCSRALVTAGSGRWLREAALQATGYGTSTIMCDCEAGVDYFTDEAPDGRPGVVLQFHVPKFKKEHVRELELALIRRLGQCVLPCPTARIFNPSGETEVKFEIGRKLGFFGDGFQEAREEFGRKVTAIPIMMGEFLVEDFLYADYGVMGGNLWFMAESEDAALAAAEAAVEACNKIEGVITPFPGGIASSGSKVRSLKYDFLIATTNHEFCPSLRGKVESKLPEGVESVSEVIINGVSEEVVREAMLAGVKAAEGIDGLVKISAGNYGGKLGKHHIKLKN